MTIREQAKKAWRGEHYNDQHTRGPEDSYIAGYMAAVRQRFEIPSDQWKVYNNDFVFALTRDGDWHSCDLRWPYVVVRETGNRLTAADVFVLVSADICPWNTAKELWPTSNPYTVHY